MRKETYLKIVKFDYQEFKKTALENGFKVSKISSTHFKLVPNFEVWSIDEAKKILKSFLPCYLCIKCIVGRPYIKYIEVA